MNKKNGNVRSSLLECKQCGAVWEIPGRAYAARGLVSFVKVQGQVRNCLTCGNSADVKLIEHRLSDTM